jgi:hypothetical protein
MHDASELSGRFGRAAGAAAAIPCQAALSRIQTCCLALPSTMAAASPFSDWSAFARGDRMYQCFLLLRLMFALSPGYIHPGAFSVLSLVLWSCLVSPLNSPHC